MFSAFIYIFEFCDWRNWVTAICICQLYECLYHTYERALGWGRCWETQEEVYNDLGPGFRDTSLANMANSWTKLKVWNWPVNQKGLKLLTFNKAIFSYHLTGLFLSISCNLRNVIVHSGDNILIKAPECVKGDNFCKLPKWNKLRFMTYINIFS